MSESSLSCSGGGLIQSRVIEDALHLLLHRAAVEQGEHLVDDGKAAVDEVGRRLRVVASQHGADRAGDLLLDDALDGVAVEGEVLEREPTLRGEAGAATGDDEVEETEVGGGQRSL